MACCRSDGCCGGFMGILVLVLSLFTVAFPWYFAVVKPIEGSDCEIMTLVSWMDSYCVAKNCPDGACETSKTNWQDDCSGVDGCDDRKRVFDVTLGLVAVSTFCALFVALGFCIRCCSSSYKRRNPLHIITNLMALILLGGALTYFAVKIPDTNPMWCAMSTPTGFWNDCGRFWGSNNTLMNVTWGPAGWISGVFTAVFILISLCMSCQRSGDEIELGTYYSVGEHGEGSYNRAPSSHNHKQTNYTATGTNYVGNSN